MGPEFPDSANLALIFKMYGWALYDITTSLDNPFSPSLAEIAFDESTRYEIYHRYYLLPIAKERESLTKTYASSRAGQTHPILRIPTKLSKEEKTMDIKAEDGFTSSNFNCYYLNEFYFKEDTLYTSNSLFFAPNFTSRVAIPTSRALEAFSRYFSLAQFTDDGILIKKLEKKLYGY